MKKIFAILALSALMTLLACKKEANRLTEIGSNMSGTLASKLIGGGNFINSIACGQPISVTMDLKLDFGAVGDGITDDSQAFLKAAQWINTSWNASYAIELYIPTGVYRVGLQLSPGTSVSYGTGIVSNPAGGPTLLGIHMLDLNGAKNVYIHGDPGLSSQIIYKNGLYFGGMTGPGSPCDFGSGCNTCGSGSGGSNRYATVGDFIKLTNCSCVTIDELDINGNAQNCQLMGHYGECNGYELSYTGIHIKGGQDITISNVNSNNFGQDGLMTGYATSNPKNITLTNLNCIANCRQGFSFDAGDNVVATNCKFNQTGTIFYNNPGCGMDIEPESGGMCVNSSFNACEFNDNMFVGMISDGHGASVSGITFSLCTFSASFSGSWSIWPNQMSNTIFTQCTIRGAFTHVAGLSMTDKIFFQLCTITDWNGSFSTPVSGWNKFLMDFGAGLPTNHFYNFGGCTFDIHHSYLIMTTASGAPSPYFERYYENCNFIFNYADLKASPAVTGNMIGRFVNSCFYNNSFTETAPVSSFPPNPTCYWVGIYLGASGTNPGVDNYSYGGNNFANQDGLGGNPWTRVYRAGNWLFSNGGNRTAF